MLKSVAELKPGFTNPVMGSQATFRAVLHALSYPGRVMEAGEGLDPPPPLHRATAAIGLCLADLDTPVWLDKASATPTVETFFQFHCGCPLVGTPDLATFAIIADATDMPPFEDFNRGTDEFPDRSATMIIEAVRFLQGSGGVRLSGPGIENELTILIEGLPSGFWRERRAQQALFPRGIDIVFVAGHGLVGLPRTTSVKL